MVGGELHKVGIYSSLKSVWYRWRLRGACLLVCCTVLYSGVTGAQSWWDYNRMQIACLFLGVWGDGGPGFERYLDYHETQLSVPQESGRLYVLLRHWSPGLAACAPADEDKHWVFVEKISVERDWAEANFMLALRHGYGSFFGGAILSNRGEAGEKYAFGINNDLGDGKNLDLQKSFILLEKSAEQGYHFAQTALSYVYYTGMWGKHGELKVKADPQISLMWLDKAAAQDDRDALFYSGYRRRYAEQYGLEQDDEKAFADFEKAANKGHIGAMVELAWMHAKGEGVAQNSQKANKWIENAVVQHTINPTLPGKSYNSKEYVEFNRQEILATIERMKKP